jgi:hypothetical protein
MKGGEIEGSLKENSASLKIICFFPMSGRPRLTEWQLGAIELNPRNSDQRVAVLTICTTDQIVKGHCEDEE